MSDFPPAAKTLLDAALAKSHLRSTRQREHVFMTLLKRRDHPTADEVYARSRESMPTISLATVYNCLETLVSCGLVRAVNYEREPTRFCPNLQEHAHFQDRDTGRVYDIDLPDSVIKEIMELLPAGYEAESINLHFLGKAPSTKRKTS